MLKTYTGRNAWRNDPKKVAAWKENWAAARAEHTYKPKPCATCGQDFQPTGGRQKYCDNSSCPPANVWNERKGRRGAA